MWKQGIEMMLGHAELRTPHSVSIGGQVVSAKHILLASDCETVPPEIDGLEEAGFITNKEGKV